MNRWPSGAMRVAVALLALVCAFAAAPAFSQERVSSFDATVRINPGSDIVVDEAITVISEDDQIRHGIFRDIPLRYVDEHGVRRSAGLTVLAVTRDGRPEPYSVSNRGSGVRITIGDADVLLSPGVHRYGIRYRSTRQLGYFDDYDELYWNVTGTGWAFPIEEASARILLPQGASITSTAAYTGRQGQAGRDWRLTDETADSVTFATTRTLAPNEGFTVAVSWPPGFVTRPTSAQQAEQFARDNRTALVGGAGLAVLLVYFIAVWRRVGRDPKGGVIVAEYEPPAGFSPAACRYVRRMGFDNAVLTAAIVNMAVKGALRIRQEEDESYTLERAQGQSKTPLSSGEQAAFTQLLGAWRDRLELRNSNHATIGKARKALVQKLQAEFERKYFSLNTGYLLPGIAIGGATILLMIVLSPLPQMSLFMAIWLGIWGVGCFTVLNRVGSNWAVARHSHGAQAKFIKGAGAIFTTLFAAPFVIGLLIGLFVLFKAIPIFVGVLIGLIILTCFAFYHWLKAPTRLGRQMLDKIEGFRLYLSVAEKDRMNFHNPPERTPDLFEKFLPYALALDVAQQWSEQFDSVLAAAGTDTGGGYRPGWYVGGYGYPYGFGSIGDRIGTGLTAAVATASVAPRSSGSGSFGGGGVGGGGGGGGGGGW